MLPKRVIKILIVSSICNIIHSGVQGISISSRNESTFFNATASTGYEGNWEEEEVVCSKKNSLLQSANFLFCITIASYIYIIVKLRQLENFLYFVKYNTLVIRNNI